MDAVTGAFSYSGAAIAGELVRRGRQVCTLTNHPVNDAAALPPELAEVSVRPLALLDPDALRASLAGVDTLYNTYWVRFPHGSVTFDTAVDGSEALFAAAADVGVRRVVHVSITHADEASPYGYFRGKGRVERLLRESGLSYAVVRPAILFGGRGVLINNMAWLLRRSPLALYGGTGAYRIRGIHIEDLASLMADLGEEGADRTLDAVGPESLTFRELLTHLRSAVGSRTVLLPVPGGLFPLVTWALGCMLGDRLLTREEYLAMAGGLADSDAPATGRIRLTEWIRNHAAQLGRSYAHELDRHFRPGPALNELVRAGLEQPERR